MAKSKKCDRKKQQKGWAGKAAKRPRSPKTLGRGFLLPVGNLPELPVFTTGESLAYLPVSTCAVSELKVRIIPFLSEVNPPALK